MRLATYRGPAGDFRSAAVVAQDGADLVIDLHEVTGGLAPAGDLLRFIEAGPSALQSARTAISAGQGTRIAAFDLVAPIPRPPKLLAVAGNYQAHIQEGGADPVDKWTSVPKLFLKPASTVIGPGAQIPYPRLSHALDWELELAVVVGRFGHQIPAEDALEYVAGYTVLNDVSARTMEWGLEGRNADAWDGFFDWLNGKWGDGFAPSGPWLVTPDEIPDPQTLRLRLEVNGRTYQDGSTSQMIFTVAELISFASKVVTLEPGDVIATGTPDGVGDATGTYLKPGDAIQAWIEGIGTLQSTVGEPSPAR